jgi:WD40 repeat protein
MFSNQTAEVSLNVPVRALDAVRGDKVDSRFIAGSCSVRNGEDNHLHILRFHSEANQLGEDAALPHPTGPVAEICTSPSDKSVVLTLAEDSSFATLWKIPPEVMEQTEDIDYDDDNDDLPNAAVGSMEETARLEPSDGTKLVDIKWRGAFDEEPSGLGDILTLDQDGKITQWDAFFGTAESTRNTSASVGESRWNLPPRMAWDPHNVDTTAVSSGTYIKLVDWRADTSVPAGTVQSFQCHRYGITDLDYNPNKPYVLTTAGQDGLLKFWDLRSAKQPLLVIRGGHRHWTSRVSYNPFHDQLVISAGTDSLVNLWRVSTISSAPLLTLDEDGDDKSETSGPNVRVSRYEHMDSVYATTWGAADAWIYASAGYDGKVVLNHVPSKEKYKIIL